MIKPFIHKKAVDEAAANLIEEKYRHQPHGRIQWKGTDVCMDFFCKCGESTHIDADFVFFIQCPYCKTVFKSNPHIEMIELEIEPNYGVFTPDLND